MKYDSIILNAYWFSEGSFWNFSATGYIGEDDPVNIEIDPNPYDEEDDEEGVKQELRLIGDLYVDDSFGDHAEMVCLHLEGSEFKCLTPDTETVKVSELVEGDAVDLKSCPYTKDNPIAEFEYIEVSYIEQESDQCIAVGLEGVDTVGYSPNQQLVIKRRK